MKLRTKVAALSFAAASVAAGGAVYAAWTSTASGTGSAASTTSENGVIAGVTPVDGDDLYPGATKSAFVTITNPNDYPVIVTKIYSGASRAITDGCAANAVRTDADEDATGLTRSDEPTSVVDAGETAEYELVLRMSNTAADNCKDAAFVIGDGANSANPLHADVKSAASANGF